jgi:hypothetical protein
MPNTPGLVARSRRWFHRGVKRLPFPAAVLVLLAACSQAVDRTVPQTPTPPATTAATPAASPTSATTGPTPTPGSPAPTVSPSPTSTRPPAIPLRGLPEQGVAVEHAGAVDLHDLFTGKLIAHLSGFSIYDPTAAPAHLILQRGATYYLLEEFERRLRPLASRAAAARLSGHDEPGIDLPAPESGGKPMDGHWRYRTPDPRYEGRVLAQWSGECEVPTAFFVDADEGEALPVTGETDPATAPESFAEGWTKRGQAVVFLPEGACGPGAPTPGISLFRTAGKGRLVVATKPQSFVRMWGTTIAD